MAPSNKRLRESASRAGFIHGLSGCGCSAAPDEADVSVARRTTSPEAIIRIRLNPSRPGGARAAERATRMVRCRAPDIKRLQAQPARSKSISLRVQIQLVTVHGPGHNGGSCRNRLPDADAP